MGQVVGTSDSRDGQPMGRIVGAQNVLGTVNHALGIDPAETLADCTGRPRYVLDDGQPIAELV